MAIINGQLTSADEVMNAMSSNFVDNANLLFNADYIGFNSKLNNDGVPQLKNVDYDTFTSDTATDTNMYYDSAMDAYIGPVQDDNDMSVLNDFTSDASNWSITGSGDSGSESVTDSGGMLVIKVTVSPSSAYQERTAVAVWDSQTNLFGDYSGVIRFYTGGITGGGSGSYSPHMNGTVNVSLVGNSGQTVTIYAESGGGAEGWTVEATYIDVIKIGTTLYIRTGASGNWTGTSLSDDTYGLKTTIYCKEGHGGSAGGTRYTQFKLDWAKYNDLADAMELISPAATATASVTNIVGFFNYTSAGTVVHSISADNGSNYTTVNMNEIARPTAGTQIKHKISITEGTALITERAVKYNLY